MIIEEGEDLFGQQGQECACCGVVVFDFQFISWDFSDNGCIARVAIHPKCAVKFMAGLESDLYEIGAGH